MDCHVETSTQKGGSCFYGEVRGGANQTQVEVTRPVRQLCVCVCSTSRVRVFTLKQAQKRPNDQTKIL